MPRVLRGSSSSRRTTKSSRDVLDAQIKDRNDIENIATSCSSCAISSLRFLGSLLSPSSNSANSGASKSWRNVTLQLVRFGLILVLILALLRSFWWTISISTSSGGNIFLGHRQLQKQVIEDLAYLEMLLHGQVKLKGTKYCPDDYKNYIPCYNISKNKALGYSGGNDYDRRCDYGSTKDCLVLPPKNYRVPLKWPTGRDLIWMENMKITAQEVLYSG